MDMDPSVGCGCQRFGGLGRSSSIGGIHSADALRPAAAMEGAPTPCPGAVVSTPLTQEACDALCRRRPTAYATKCFSKRSETLFSCDRINWQWEIHVHILDRPHTRRASAAGRSCCSGAGYPDYRSSARRRPTQLPRTSPHPTEYARSTSPPWPRVKSTTQTRSF